MLVSIALFMPLTVHYKEILRESYVNSVWRKLEPDRIASLVAEGHIVVVDVTADWCLTCKLNKFKALERGIITNFLGTHNIIAMRADITTHNQIAFDFLKQHKQYGVPFNIVYGPDAKDGIILPSILSTDDIISAIYKAGLASRNKQLMHIK